MILKNISKFVLISVCALLINSSYIDNLYAHEHTPKKQLIKKLKKEITDLGAKPVKKKGLFSKEQKWIDNLEAQLEKLKKIEELKAEIIKELKDLGEEPKTDLTKAVEADDQIVSLRKQLVEVKTKKKQAE